MLVVNVKLDKIANTCSVVEFQRTIHGLAARVVPKKVRDIDVLNKLAFFLTIPFFIVALVLIFVKHIKNNTLLKHTLIYLLLSKLFIFIKNVYNSGSNGVKTVLLVAGYPIAIAITFFIFPITIGFAVWFTYKQVKKFNVIKEGVEQIKAGDFHHRIEADRKGEFASLANNINTITDGLKTAVNLELKSERMKLDNGKSIRPFDTPDMPFEMNGVLSMLVGQGSDGDYNGNSSELYQSKDKGQTWNFVKEVKK